LHDLQLESIQDDLAGNCQCIFLCAYLQSRLGQHVAALASIERAWKLAEKHGLQQISCSAAWGACAICARRGNYQEAADWLSRLQDKLKDSYEWVLIGVLELFKQVLETHVSNTNEGLIVWLLRWGEWPLPETAYPSKGDYKIQSATFPAASIVSRLKQLWNSLWDSRSKESTSRRLLQRDAIQNTESLPRPEAFHLDAKLVSSTTTFFSQNSQAPSAVSDPSDRVLQAHATGSPLLPDAGLGQAGRRSLGVYCLGQFQVYQDEQLVENWLSRKGLSVFKYLILEHPAPVGKEILMDTFWPDSDPESARRNLHQAIYCLRQTFRGEQQEFHHIWFKNDCYSLNPNMETWIDFREFQKGIEAGRRLEIAGQIEEAIEQYGTAEGLYHGEFLEEDLYEEWPVVQRQQLLNQYSSLVDKLSESYFQNRQYAAAVHFCQKILAKDRCYEAAHRMLMQCYLAQGLRHLAIRQYQTCIRALREEVDIEPSEETVTLYKHIVSQS
jgi:DNA-binding SARP family transcriptional activator